ncbi:hypothetical protein SDC9_105888 [bioreactor metagenome]|uniref:Uncharacterized protein n=1 Tax=bioreactor metagenome TaxID=1076179 RepID=A0A645B0T3_9ZZZZ
MRIIPNALLRIISEYPIKAKINKLKAKAMFSERWLTFR